jgi:Ni,Fe-hydrogenase I cytochrome b subunit
MASAFEDSPPPRKRYLAPIRVWHYLAVEFLNFVLIFLTGYLVLRRPERERLAFGLLITSCLLMATLFLIGARGSILPGLNY